MGTGGTVPSIILELLLLFSIHDNRRLGGKFL